MGKAAQIEAFEQLEREIESEFAAKAQQGKGCFGSLHFNGRDAECRECEFFLLCEEVYAKTHLGALAALEKDIEQEGVDLALDMELASLALYEAQKASGALESAREDPTVDGLDIAIPEIAVPEIAMPEIVLPELTMQTTIEEENAQMSTTVKTAKDANWGGIVMDVIIEKPATYADACKLVVSHLISDGVDEADVRKNYNNLTKALLSGLEKCLVLEYNATTKAITYRS